MDDPVITSSNQVLPDATGNQPKIAESTLKVQNRVIGNVNQAVSVCETMVNDAKKIILHATRITAKINGQRPYDQKRLKDAGKDYKSNISTGFLASECARVAPRFFMPIKTAKYLTSASLPIDWPEGEAKSDYFRQVITDTIRGWPKFNFYIRGLSKEVINYGYAFNAFFDEFDWRPNLMRMDKGFVPQGTEIMEEPAFFMAKFDYRPHQLLALLEDAVDSGVDNWKKQNVVSAIRGSIPPPVDATYPNARAYEELTRQAVWGYRYTKGEKLIQTWHLFAKEASGGVSHYIILANSSNVGTPDDEDEFSASDYRLLYEKLDKYPSMSDAVNASVFDYGDGTIHGCWGVAQILYDLSSQVEKVRNDSIDNIRMTNKMKIAVQDGKNVNDVKLTVNDQYMIVSNSNFSGNTAGLTSDVNGYVALDDRLTQLAQQKIGAFVPPIPLQPSDIKAAQVNAAMIKEREVQEALLENWLVQWALVVRSMQRRLCNFDSPDAVALSTQEQLLKRLTREEISLLANDPTSRSILEFTEYKAQQRAMFAQSVMGNANFRQSAAARIMASGVGDARFVAEIVNPEGDTSEQTAQARQQILENAALAIGQTVPIVPTDNDWIHMQAMQQPLQVALSGGASAGVARVALNHYAGHYDQGVAKKGIPDDQINEQKGFIAKADKLVAEMERGEQIKQAGAQAEEQVNAQMQADAQMVGVEPPQQTQ